MSAVREAVNDRANDLVNVIEALRIEQELRLGHRGTVADDASLHDLEAAARLQDMERDLAELKAFLESGDE